jgi:hypothetical protein
MNNIDIGELVKLRENCPIKPDMSFTISAKQLGPPDWWEFGGSDPFSAMLGYGDFRIELWVVESRVEIRRIGLLLWEALGGEPAPKRKKIKIAKRVKVDLSGYLPGADLANVKDKLEREGVAFVESRHDDVSETKAILTVNNHTELVFFSMEGHLSLAEIQLFSKLPGA